MTLAASGSTAAAASADVQRHGASLGVTLACALALWTTFSNPLWSALPPPPSAPLELTLQALQAPPMEAAPPPPAAPRARAQESAPLAALPSARATPPTPDAPTVAPTPPVAPAPAPAAAIAPAAPVAPALPAAPPHPSSAAVEADFVARVRALLNAGKRYPTGREASMQRPQGKVRVWFKLGRDGNLIDAGVQDSSNSLLLDGAALATVRRATFFALPATAWAGQEQHLFSVELEFLSPSS